MHPFFVIYSQDFIKIKINSVIATYQHCNFVIRLNFVMYFKQNFFFLNVIFQSLMKSMKFSRKKMNFLLLYIILLFYFEFLQLLIIINSK